jgi:SAM-dependent methyltransferase
MVKLTVWPWNAAPSREVGPIPVKFGSLAKSTLSLPPFSTFVNGWSERQPPFDLAISAGVLHHLNDAEVRVVLQLAGRIVRPRGRLVAMVPCYVRDQHPIAKFMKDHDRGRHIRAAEDYRQLFASVGPIETRVLSGMLPIPFTTIVAT